MNTSNIKWQNWGKESLPLLVIDNFYPEPEKLIEFATNRAAFRANPDDFYPGERALADENYIDFVKHFFADNCLALLIDNANNSPERMSISTPFSVYSITTQQESSLLPIQCIPHFDQADNEQWACVHYLFHEDCGGTGFFRHRRSGFESISPTRLSKYQRMLEDDAYEHGVPAKQYIAGDHDLFSLQYSVNAVFNRAIFYPSNVLHSGLINTAALADFPFPRLTANSLFSVKSPLKTAS